MCSVLLVEDCKEILIMMDFILKNEGKHTVFPAETLHQAKNVLNTQSIDWVITDFNLPDGNGNHVAQCAREVGVPKVWLQSADPDQADSKLFDKVLYKSELLRQVKCEK